MLWFWGCVYSKATITFLLHFQATAFSRFACILHLASPPPPFSPLHPHCFFSPVILKGLTLLAPWWLLFHFILIKILRAFFNIPA